MKRTSMWHLGACVVALLACKGEETSFGKGFVKGCGETCQSSGGDSSCNDWCQCIYDQAVEDQGSPKKADAWLIDNATGGNWSPELSKHAGEAITRCAPGLYEKKTLHACQQECAGDAECEKTCGCLLDELMKAKGSKEESIVFLIVNVDMAETPEGTAAIEKAAQACQPAP